ncbi:MAG: serine hydrolase [Phycisphaerales bacterium]
MNALGRIAWAAILVSLGLTRAGGSEPADLTHDGSDVASEIDDYLGRLESFGFHGSVLVARGDDIVLCGGYGVADHASGAPITADTVFHLGSLGKQFTASAILLLEMEGKLSVHDTIGQHFPDAPADKREITIYQLLTHTAGFAYQPGDGPMLDLPLEYTPGERWSYSNPGYAVLHDLVESVSGESFCAFMDSRFFEPLAMTRTGCARTGFEGVDNLARAYTDNTDQGAIVEIEWSPRYRGAGDIGSSVRDLFAWEQALRNSSILSREAIESLFTGHVRTPGGEMEYGYGWMILTTERGSRIARHPGNYGGFNCDYRRYLDEDLTIILLSNHFAMGQSMREAALNDVSRIVNGGETKNPPRVIELDPKRLNELEGTYEFDDGNRLTVSAVDGGLAVGSATVEGYALLYEPDLLSAHRVQLRRWSDASCEFIDAAATRRETEPLRAVISPALPFDGAAADLLELLDELQESFGVYRRVRPAATISADRGRSARIFLELEFERGAALIETTWRGGVLHIDRATALPTRRFLPTDEHIFTAYDIFSGHQTDIRFSTEGEVNLLHIDQKEPERIGRRR